jgi:hypothetical protein
MKENKNFMLISEKQTLINDLMLKKNIFGKSFKFQKIG